MKHWPGGRRSGQGTTAPLTRPRGAGAPHNCG
jgi:hypothetical protein